MDYGTIISDVVEATGRPDKVTYVTNRVNPVVRILASLQDSYNDLVESVETWTVDSGNPLVYNLPIPANFRKACYLRPTGFAKALDPVTPDHIIQNLRGGGAELTNVYYISNSIIIARVRNGFQASTVQFGAYTYPTTLAASTDTNWITDTYGDLVVDMICAMVFRLTGDIKSAQGLEGGSSGIAARMELIKTNNKTGGVQNIIGTHVVS